MSEHSPNHRLYRCALRHLVPLLVVLFVTATPVLGAGECVEVAAGVGDSMTLLTQVGLAVARQAAIHLLPVSAADAAVEQSPLKKQNQPPSPAEGDEGSPTAASVRLIISGLLALLVTGLTVATASTLWRAWRAPVAYRRCRHCGFIGQMRLKILHRSHQRKAMFLAMAGVVPGMIYIVSQQGKFKCPRCRRTRENVLLDDVE